MRILLLTDNFVPETNSPSRRAYEHAKEWIANGVETTVITSIPNFPTGQPLPPYRNRLWQVELCDGIRVVRVWTFLSANSGIFWRSLDFLSFAVSAFAAGLFERCDVIVATSPQLLTGVTGWWLATVKRRPWLFEIRDIWPDSIVSVGIMRENLFVRALRGLERKLYRSAARVIAVSTGIRDRLVARGVLSEKIAVVPNGVDLARFAPERRCASLRDRLSLRDKFVAGYIGTHGLAQGLETVLDAARILKNSNVHFLFVGEGARRAALASQVEKMRIDNVTLIGLVPAEVAAEYLHVCDVILVPLKRTDQIEITLPGKLFEAAAASKPIIVSAEGASAELVRQYQAGLVVPPEEPEALADAVMQLRNDASLRSQLSKGSLALARDFDRSRFAREMLDQIASVVRSA